MKQSANENRLRTTSLGANRICRPFARFSIGETLENVCSLVHLKNQDAPLRPIRLTVIKLQAD